MSPLVRELGLVEKFPVGSEHDIAELRRKCDRTDKRCELDDLLAKVDAGDPVANLYFGRLYHKDDGAQEAKKTLKRRWAGKRPDDVEPPPKKGQPAVVDG